MAPFDAIPMIPATAARIAWRSGDGSPNRETTDDTAKIGNPEYFTDIEFRKPADEAKLVIQDFQPLSDHCGVTEDAVDTPVLQIQFCVLVAVIRNGSDFRVSSTLYRFLR